MNDDASRATRLAAAPQGWVLVPVEPTPEMLEATKAGPVNYPLFCWHAMLDAAPAASSPAPVAESPEDSPWLDPIRDPLNKLLDLADDSDGACYGTLSTSIARQLITEALVALDRAASSLGAADERAAQEQQQ